jgi:hypothetical protein
MIVELKTLGVPSWRVAVNSINVPRTLAREAR